MALLIASALALATGPPTFAAWCGVVAGSVTFAVSGVVSIIIYSTNSVAERLTPDALTGETSEIVPAALADRSLSETFSALTAANPYAADSVASRAKFCLSCNCNLAAYHRLTSEWQGKDGHSCIALVPQTCSVCRRTSEPPILVPVRFIRSEEAHWSCISMRSAKDISEKKSLQTAITVVAEGRSVTEFCLNSEIMLHFGGLLETLRATPTCPRYRSWVEEHSVQRYLSAAMCLRKYTVSTGAQEEFDFDHILWVQPNHNLTNRVMCSQWKSNAPDLQVFESIGDRSKRRIIEAVGLKAEAKAPAAASNTEPSTTPTTKPPQGPSTQMPSSSSGGVSSAPDKTVPPAAGMTEVEEMLNQYPPGLGFPTKADLGAVRQPTGAQAMRYKDAIAAELVRHQDSMSRMQGNLLPVRVYENMSREDLETITADLFKNGRLPNIDEYVRPYHDILMLGQVRMKKHREDVKYVLKDYVRRVGPLLSNTVVWDNKDYVTKTISAAYRCITPGSWQLAMLDPEDEPSNKQKNLLQGKINRFFQSARNTVFTEERIKHWVKKCPLLEELRGKYTVESITNIIDQMRGELGLRPASANIKLEVTTKGAKSPRIVIDCGAERTIVETVVAWVFDHVLFDYCGSASIKGKDRTACLDAIADECSWPVKFPTCLIELDQTGFDAHNRCWAKYDAPPGEDSQNGIFPKMAELFHHVASVIPRSNNELWANFSVVEDQDKAGRAYLKFKGTGDKKQQWTALIKELYMLSGRKITSSGNFLCELCILLCCFVENPERIFTVGGLDSFDWTFRCSDGRTRYFRCWLEGDDALARADAWFSTPDVKARFIQACVWMGFEAKLVVVIGTDAKPARAEFVGAHFLSIGGKTFRRFWVPDIARGLVSVGAYCLDPNCLDAATQCQQIAVSMASRALGYAGRCDPAANYVLSLAADWAASAAAISSTVCTEILAGGFQAEARGVEGMGYTQLVEMCKQRASTEAFSYAHQAKLASASVEGDVSCVEFSRWLAGSSSFTVESCPLDVLESLPSALAGRFIQTGI